MCNRVPCVYKGQNLTIRVEEFSKPPNYLAIKVLYQGGQTLIFGGEVLGPVCKLHIVYFIPLSIHSFEKFLINMNFVFENFFKKYKLRLSEFHFINFCVRRSL